MDLMLRAIEVSHRRNWDGENAADVAVHERPCIRSFVEAILTSAVLSVESRTYQRAWLRVAMAQETGCGTLVAYLVKPVATKLSSRWTLQMYSSCPLKRQSSSGSGGKFARVTEGVHCALTFIW